MAEIVRQAIAFGAKEVIVFDHTCNNWERAYKTSGIEAAAKDAGARIASAASKEDYGERSNDSAVKMKKALIHKELLAADVVIKIGRASCRERV